MVINRTSGAASIVTGTVNSSTPPAIPVGALPCVRIVLQYNTVAIDNLIIFDERAFSDLTQTPAPYVAVRATLNNVDQTNIPPSTYTKINYSATDFNLNSAFNTGTSRFAPAAAGYYAVSAQIAMNISTGVATSVNIFKNGSLYSYNQTIGGGNGYYTAAVYDILYMNGTDYVEIYTWHGNATAVTCSGQRNVTFLTASRLA